MKKIMVDMDDVLVVDRFIEIMSKFLGKEIVYKDNDNYYLQDLLGDKKTDFFKYFKTINLYETASLAKDVYSILKELNQKYEIYICTSYIWKEIVEEAGNNTKYKYDFLRKELPFIDPYKIVFACDKSIINCDIKIDDRIENLEGAEIKLLYTAYHNKNISEEEPISKGIIRVNSWADIKQILLEDNDNI